MRAFLKLFLQLKSHAWWRQPLFHFLVAGALIFMLDALRGQQSERADSEILISAMQVRRLASLWEQSRGRPPTEADLDAAIQDHIQEEIFYREALRLNLDEDDPIVRRRMRQKVEYLLKGDVEEPGLDELRDYYDSNSSQYVSEPTYHFEQVYLGESAEDAGLVMTALRKGTAAKDAGGALINLPSLMSEVDTSDVARLFGEDFAEGLAHLEPGAWQGPVWSGFGAHFVKILSVKRGGLAPFDMIQQRVRNDWLSEKRREATKAAFDQIRSGYEVIIER